MPAAVAVPLISAGIGAGSSIFSGISGRNAAKEAATKQANAAESTIKYTNDRLGDAYNSIDNASGSAVNFTQPNADWAQSLMMPYIQGGEQGQKQLNDILAQPVDKFSYDPSKIADDPGYQFTLAQGIKALDQSAAARGQTLSGGQLKAITGYGQGNAATYENQFYNQALSTYDTNRDTLQQRVGNLFGLTGQGMSASQYAGNVGINEGQYASNAMQNAAALKAQLGMQAAGMYGNAQTGAANSTAAATMYGNQAISSGITSAGNDLSQALFLSQILKQPSYGASPGYGGSPGTNGLPQYPIPGSPVIVN
jgi:hypothetical protein